jgi:hypothetical protein
MAVCKAARGTEEEKVTVAVPASFDTMAADTPLTLSSPVFTLSSQLEQVMPDT